MTDPRYQMLSLLDGVDNGRYAVRADSNRPWTYFRMTRPKLGNYKGALKLQTQHGPNYKLVYAKHLGTQKIWTHLPSHLIEQAMILISNQQWAAVQYGRLMKKCCRCGAELTDEHSQHYGIGPECVKYWPHIVELVDAGEVTV